MISGDIRKKLREPFPAEAISRHPTKTFLSTIKAIYIVERLNDIFGIGGWDLEHEIINDSPEYVSVRGRIVVFETEKFPTGFHTPDQYGGHGKTGKNTEPADGYKSAVTDCQSKCASYLEIGIDVFKGLGNAPAQKKPYQKKQGAPNSQPAEKKPFDNSKIKDPDAPATENQLRAIDNMCKKADFMDIGKENFIESVLTLTSLKKDTKAWASDLIGNFNDYYTTWRATKEIV